MIFLRCRLILQEWIKHSQKEELTLFSINDFSIKRWQYKRKREKRMRNRKNIFITIFYVNVIILSLLLPLFSTLEGLFIMDNTFCIIYFLLFSLTVFIYRLMYVFHKNDSENDKASRYNFIKFHYYHPTHRACAALSSLLYVASLVRREIGWVWSMKLTRYCHRSVLDMTFDNAS